MKNALIVVSTLLVLISPLVYIHSILKGETKPHRTTRFVLLVIAIVSSWSLIDSNWSAALWLALASTAQAIAVFVISIKHGYGGWAKLDIGCLVIAIIGIIFWQITGRPLLGLFASIVADYIGMVPAIVKTYKLPNTENWVFFMMDTCAGILSFLALSSITVYSASFPIYIVLINGAMVILILTRRNKQSTIKT